MGGNRVGGLGWDMKLEMGRDVMECEALDMMGALGWDIRHRCDGVEWDVRHGMGLYAVFKGIWWASAKGWGVGVGAML